MTHVSFNDQRFTLKERETVLDCLLRHRQDIEYSCKSGVCHSCMVKSLAKVTDPNAQLGLKDTLQAQNYVLTCQWRPQENVAITPLTTISNNVGQILDLTLLNQQVMRLRIAIANNPEIIPGQFIKLTNQRGTTRHYSVANDHHQDHFIELHVKHIINGAFSDWLFEQAQIGQQLTISSPAGNCFYVAGDQQNQPLILAGVGTGLAPLIGIVKDALAQGHRGPISLLHGAHCEQQLYYVDELNALANQHSQFSYQSCLKTAPQVSGINDSILRILRKDHINSRIYLCGSPEFVQSLRKSVFINGAQSRHIFCDIFAASINLS